MNIFAKLLEFLNPNKKNLSVIIPTVQKNTIVLNKLVSILNRDKVVSEILIINNLQQELKIDKYKKVKIYNSKENLYVNPSWNFGIKKIKNSRFLIINDDILCCENFCTRVLDTGILEREDTGLVGLSNSYIHIMPPTIEDMEIPTVPPQVKPKFVEMQNFLGTGDWGSAFFGKKKNYPMIPDSFRIIYGDNYILKKNLDEGRKNYETEGLTMHHIHSLSSASAEFSDIVGSDCANANNYF